MRNLIVLLGLLQLSLVSASAQPAQTPTAKSIKDKAFIKAIRQAEAYVDSLRTRQAIPGLSVCVGTPNKVLWAQGFGYADLEAQLPVTIDTKFRLGSVSKSVTSLAIGRLVEQQQLDLDQPIQRYVPTFPLKKHPVTPRQLATHTAGIRHYRDSDPIACSPGSDSLHRRHARLPADSSGDRKDHDPGNVR
ncbi:serine hydrolase domain-containing protein [uncultured Fibrella sp.]|uniref:serine hydrolase domain-containing protein n=1 Tax=uncultured Fibrella sp. TaxID=1284596 RepID=UPI0035CC571C